MTGACSACVYFSLFHRGMRSFHHRDIRAPSPRLHPANFRPRILAKYNTACSSYAEVIILHWMVEYFEYQVSRTFLTDAEPTSINYHSYSPSRMPSSEQWLACAVTLRLPSAAQKLFICAENLKATRASGL